MRVVVAPYRFNGSGMTSYSKYLLRALKISGADVSIVGFDLKGSRVSEVDENYISMGADPEYLNLFGGPMVTYAYVRKILTRVLNNIGDFDVIHFIYPGATVRPKNSDAKIFTSAWGFQSPLEVISEAPKNFNGYMRYLSVIHGLEHYYLDKNGYEVSDAIAGTTTRTIEFWNDRLTVLKGRYIPPPVDVPNDGISSMQYKNSDTVTITVGERDLNRARNNVDSILAAAKMCFDRRTKNFKLYLVGNANKRLLEWISSLQGRGLQIEHIPYLARKEFHALLNKTDICLIPRIIKDQGGYWPLEAMARGCAVIASDIPAFRDFVIDGYNGFLINPRDPLEISQKIESLLGDRETLFRLQLNAQRFIKSTHSPEKVGKILLRYYEEIE